MLDIRATHYVSPLSEVDFTDVPLTVHLQNFADETGYVTGLFRVYNDTTGELIHDSAIAPLSLAAGQSADVSALTDFSPPAPLDDTYFVLFTGTAANALVPDGTTFFLGAFHFDVKPGPLGAPPAAHAPTHEQAGADPLELANLGTAELDTNLRLAPDGAGGVHWDDTVPLHVSQHAFGGPDELNVQSLPGQLADDQPPLQHDIADPAKHTSAATPGQILQADTNGLPVDATNTDADVADAVAKRNIRAVGEASNAAPTPDADTTDLYYLTALAEAATFGAPTGSPVEGQKLIIRIIDNATARALAWDAGAGGYIARGTALPATTVLSKYLYVGLIYNAIADKWDCVATSQEA